MTLQEAELINKLTFLSNTSCSQVESSPLSIVSCLQSTSQLSTEDALRAVPYTTGPAPWYDSFQWGLPRSPSIDTATGLPVRRQSLIVVDSLFLSYGLSTSLELSEGPDVGVSLGWSAQEVDAQRPLLPPGLPSDGSFSGGQLRNALSLYFTSHGFPPDSSGQPLGEALYDKYVSDSIAASYSPLELFQVSASPFVVSFLLFPFSSF